MKAFIVALTAAILVCGCDHEKFENQKMTWYGSFSTNAMLIIYAKGGPIQTNVDSLDQAANILGQYGWEFVNTGVEDGDKVFYMKRHVQKYGSFSLTPIVAPLPEK
jgi:hypothetical protein